MNTISQNTIISKEVETQKTLSIQQSTRRELAEKICILLQNGSKLDYIQEFTNDQFLQEIAISLIKNEHIDKALEFFNTYRSKKNIKINLRVVYKTLLKQDDLNSATQLIIKLSNPYERKRALQHVLQLSPQEEKINRFVEVVKKHRKSFQDESLKYIYKELIKTNFADRALEVASLTKNEEKKCRLLSTLCEKLIEIKKFNSAIKGAELISHEHKRHSWFIMGEKSKILVKICNELIEIKDFDLAIHAVKIMPHESDQSEILKKICVELIQTEQYNKVIPLAQIIPQDYERCSVFEIFCKKLVEIRKFDNAIDLIALLPNDTHRYFHYKSNWKRPTDFKCIIQKIIFEGLLKIGEVENAIKLVLEVKNDDMLEEVSTTFTEKYHIEQAPRMHRKLHFSQKRIYSLIEIFQALIKIGEEKMALNILEKMTDKEEKSIILDSLHKK